MSQMMDTPETALARRIRLERELRGWSLADLAARAEVSKASISRIERGEMSPTAVTLVRLATAFGLTLAGLLVRAEGGDRLTRAADQPLWRDPATGYVRRQIFARPDHPVEISEVEMPPGAHVTLPGSGYGHIRQVLQVRAGTLTLTEGGTRHVLEAGDSLGFGTPGDAAIARHDVTFANESAAPCRYLVALTRL